ncbi:MAG TPA: hypothetical protein PKA37_09810, partial [Planctomycetota bacterium]|nr:hypothetical protein [Planctomycetota bacterium]
KVISVHGLWLDSFGSVTGRHGFATVREGQNTQRLRFRLEGKLGACRWGEWETFPMRKPAALGRLWESAPSGFNLVDDQ